jgi:ParB-like chromosome segregation protein Spo0J
MKIRPATLLNNPNNVGAVAARGGFGEIARPSRTGAEQVTRQEEPEIQIVPIERVPIGSIHLDPSNANTHDEQDITGLMAKLATFTQVEPLLVQAKTRRVIGGNGRLEAMRRLGWSEVEVRLLDVDNVTATAMAIALNTRQSKLDDDILAQQVQALQDEGFDIDALGFTDKEIEDLFCKDEAEPDPAEGQEEILPESWMIVVECKTEQDQVSLLERFQQEGLSCRAFVS